MKNFNSVRGTWIIERLTETQFRIIFKAFATNGARYEFHSYPESNLLTSAFRQARADIRRNMSITKRLSKVEFQTFR